MAARFPEEPPSPPSQPELMAIAREIPADKINILATQYLEIDDTLMSHIADEAKSSVEKNFKCLLHWCRNTEEPDVGQALYDKLKRAAKEGLVSKKGVDILQKLQQSTSDKGKNCKRKFKSN